jgi:hypothetical protein
MAQSQAEVGGTGFQGNDAEDASVHAPQQLAPRAGIQTLQAERVFTQRQGPLVTERGYAADPGWPAPGSNQLNGQDDIITR